MYFFFLCSIIIIVINIREADYEKLLDMEFRRLGNFSHKHFELAPLAVRHGYSDGLENV